MPEQDACEDAEQPAQDGGDQHDPDHRLPARPDDPADLDAPPVREEQRDNHHEERDEEHSLDIHARAPRMPPGPFMRKLFRNGGPLGGAGVISVRHGSMLPPLRSSQTPGFDLELQQIGDDADRLGGMTFQS